MGQIVLGVMYGVEIPKGLNPWDDEAHEDGSLIDRWRKVARERYGKRGLAYTHESDKDILGYWVALYNGDEKGVPDLYGRSVPLRAFGRGRDYAAASKRFRAFAAWARRQGVKLPKPALWLAPTEVA
jgi:hypothetical protein